MMRDRPVERLERSNLLDYQLLDFGGGRKFERFGRVFLDRCSPAAIDATRYRNDWSRAEVCLDDHGDIIRGQLSTDTWQVRIADIVFNLKLTPFGHVGVFPEQRANWEWLQSLSGSSDANPSALKALNLFAYTGGSTLSLAKAGYEVVHVDASAPAVRWARDNATSNDLQSHPIRWIVEDARKFAAREVKRGRRYNIIVLDPPSFGHGPSGDRWEIESDLYPLLEICLQLLQTPGQLLLTAHSSIPAPADIIAWLQQSIGQRSDSQRFTITSNRLTLLDATQRPLDSGFCIRCTLGSHAG